MTEVVFIARPDMEKPPFVVARAGTDSIPRVHDTVAWGNEVWIVLQVLFDYREALPSDNKDDDWMVLERVHVKVQRT